jgi:hypothetical protein
MTKGLDESHAEQRGEEDSIFVATQCHGVALFSKLPSENRCAIAKKPGVGCRVLKGSAHSIRTGGNRENRGFCEINLCSLGLLRFNFPHSFLVTSLQDETEFSRENFHLCYLRYLLLKFLLCLILPSTPCTRHSLPQLTEPTRYTRLGFPENQRDRIRRRS